MNENKKDVDNQNDDQSNADSNIHLNLKQNLLALGNVLKIDGQDQNGNSIIKMFPKFFMKVLENIRKEKGLNIFNSFEYIINALIHMHFQRKEKAQTSKVNQFIEKFNLEKEPANEKVFITFMESFPEFNFFE